MSNKNRWNIKEEVQKRGEHAYRGYEGMHTEEVVEFVKHMVLAHSVDDQDHAVMDIVANLLLERIIVEEVPLNELAYYENVTINYYEAVIELLGCKEWTKSGIDWDEERVKYQEIMNDNKVLLMRPETISTSIVVDVGCGGDPERWISGAIKVDNSYEADESVNLLCEEAEDLPFPDNSVDEIFMRHSFGWMVNEGDDIIDPIGPEKVLAEVLRVLKPQGRLTIIDAVPLSRSKLMMKYKSYPVEDPNETRLAITEYITKEVDDEPEPLVELWMLYQKFVPNKK